MTTIDPAWDHPRPSADSWHRHAGIMSRGDLEAALTQARADGARMRDARDEVVLLLAHRINEVAELRDQLTEANRRAELNHKACLELMGQIDDMRDAIDTATGIIGEQLAAMLERTGVAQ